MAEAVILSAIESLDCWLLKKGGTFEENLEKLYNLIVGMSDLGEEKKKRFYSLLKVEFPEQKEVNMEEEEDEEEEVGDPVEKMYNLLDLNKEKMYSCVVGMANFWEDYKKKIYCLLLQVANGVDNTIFWGYKEKLHSLLVEIVDMWEDEEGELNKIKLHNFLFQMKNYSKKNMRILSGEVAGLWKDKQPKLNKEKLYTLLANKVDLCEPNYLLRVLLYMVLRDDSSDFHKAVKEAKIELGELLDLIRHNQLGEENNLHYFISDVVEMAHRTHFLIHLEDSEPFALFLQLSVLLQVYEYETYHQWFSRKFKRIVNGLQEIKNSMIGFRVERLHNVIEMDNDKNVVGLEEDVKLLLYGEGNSKIITVITGMAGSGKTTLARQVYNHTTITQKFERRAWVCLSKVFSRKEMLVSLIRQVVDNSQNASLVKIEHADYESLKQVLGQQLLGIQYFIVFDDVSYKMTHLKYIMKALPKGKQETRLIFTTRDRGKYTQEGTPRHGCYYHHMKSMDADCSWKLLLKTLFIEGSDKKFPKPLVKQARQMLGKCGGLPLAIKEVGRNWAKKRQSGSEWEELVKSIDLTKTLGALESVYQDWDPQLQSCFLHLAFFKEGATIRAKRLVHIWVVMGVVSDISYKKILYELLDKSVIDIDKNVKGNIKTCCVHVVFQMLSIKKAEDELKFEILHRDRNNRSPRYRAIYCSREKLMNYLSNQDEHIVSLFFYGGGYFNTIPSYWNYFEQLQTLDMEDFGLKTLPNVIGMLSELRYLGLRNNYIQELPHSLSRLKKLEVLDIALNFMVEVEDVIWEMESLHHLYMSDICCQKPLKIDNLENLETLTYVSVHNWEYEESRLERMWKLTKLGIQEVDGNTDVSKLFASLSKLKNLDFLILRGFRFKSMPSLDEIGILLENLGELKLDGLITRLPSANNFPGRIHNLTLVNSSLHEDPMPTLENIYGLRYLKLHNAYTGQQMVISFSGFFYLKYLVIEELQHLRNIQIEESAMGRLQYLEINNCPNLETLLEDYCPMNTRMFKMKTTKKNARKMKESSFVSKIRKVDIQP